MIEILQLIKWPIDFLLLPQPQGERRTEPNSDFSPVLRLPRPQGERRSGSGFVGELGAAKINLLPLGSG